VTYSISCRENWIPDKELRRALTTYLVRDTALNDDHSRGPRTSRHSPHGPDATIMAEFTVDIRRAMINRASAAVRRGSGILLRE
jgi:hypothetical protein